jgi:hypothetical protein
VPYSAQIYPLLVSSPADVSSDVATVVAAIHRWNVTYGKTFGANVLALHWGSHAAAEYGVRPQEALNRQLVEEAEIVIALLWHRLGSDTGEAESGTVEEIETAHARGAHVAVLRCTRDIPAAQVDADQIRRLDDYINRIRDSALILDYSDETVLRERVETILTRVVSTSAAQAIVQAQGGGPRDADGALARKPAQVWPTLDRREGTKTDGKGRLKTENRWYLVLANTGDEPAMRVRYVLEPDGDGEPPIDLGEGREIEVLPPGAKVERRLYLHSGAAAHARCIVKWEDSAGEHENRGTLAFY